MNKIFIIAITLTVITGLCAGYLIMDKVEISVNAGISAANKLNQAVIQRQKDIDEINCRLSEFIVSYKHLAKQKRPKKQDMFSDVFFGNRNASSGARVDIEQLERLVARLNVMTDALTDKEFNRGDTEGKNKNYIDQANKKIESLSNELAAVKEKYVLLQTQSQDMENKAADQLTQKQALDKQLRQTIKERDLLKGELDVYKKNEQELTVLSDDLRRQTVQLSAEVSTKVARLKAMEQDMDRAQAQANIQIGPLKAKLSLAQEKLRDISGKYQDLKAQLSEIADIKSQRDDELADRDKQIAELKKKAAETDDKLSKMKEYVSRAQENQVRFTQGLGEILTENKTIKSIAQMPPADVSKTPIARQTDELKRKVEVILRDAGE